MDPGCWKGTHGKEEGFGGQGDKLRTTVLFHQQCEMWSSLTFRRAPGRGCDTMPRVPHPRLFPPHRLVVTSLRDALETVWTGKSQRQYEYMTIQSAPFLLRDSSSSQFFSATFLTTRTTIKVLNKGYHQPTSDHHWQLHAYLKLLVPEQSFVLSRNHNGTIRTPYIWWPLLDDFDI